MIEQQVSNTVKTQEVYQVISSWLCFSSPPTKLQSRPHGL